MAFGVGETFYFPQTILRKLKSCECYESVALYICSVYVVALCYGNVRVPVF